MTDAKPVSLATVTAADFEPGAIFRIVGEGGKGGDLRLHKVRMHAGAPRAGGAFALTFVGAPGPWLPQAIYPLTNDKLGTLEIFLVPIGPVDGGNGYEAIFA